MIPWMLTAAALIIGNEILSGKIQEGNLSYLGQQLFSLGIVLRRAIVCPDDIDVIVRDVNELRATHDYVFTSGGVGPTHDDLTIPAIAKAFGRRVVRAPQIEELIRNYHKDRVTEDHLRMAEMPEGARLVNNAQVPWPTVIIENVYIFPGVPEIFRLKFPAVRETLRAGQQLVSMAAFTQCDEGQIAQLLSHLDGKYQTVMIGSYPRWRSPEYRVKVTFDSPDSDAASRALQEFVEALDPASVVRIER